jgi:hypothetical protein
MRKAITQKHKKTILYFCNITIGFFCSMEKYAPILKNNRLEAIIPLYGIDIHQANNANTGTHFKYLII